MMPSREEQLWLPCLSLPSNPAGSPFTRADLEDLPNDGRRYEIIDGVLIVSAAPGRLHQRATGALSRRPGPSGCGWCRRIWCAGHR